jgi:A/G-specific adenine glycosylase
MTKTPTIGMKPQTLGAFRRRMLRWFGESHRKLPWRETDDPYRIWVSEVMLQQTRVTTAIPYYERFIAKFPDVRSLARAKGDTVLKCWEGLGYYARARNLHQAAKLLAVERKGTVPDDYAQFRSLPGVGDYIAAAVFSQAFNQPFAVVDGNVKRVLARLFTIEAPVNRSSSLSTFKTYAEFLLDIRAPGDFNQAMMELGALLCRPKGPDCPHCPVRSYCKACKSSNQGKYPVRSGARPVPHYHVAVGVVRKANKILIAQRKPSGLLGGLWEVPGGKVRPDETPESTCKREIKEELNLSVDVTAHLTRVHHAYSHFKISMDVYDCRYRAGRVKLNGPDNYKWIALEEIENYAFPVANHKFIPLLTNKKKSGG